MKESRFARATFPFEGELRALAQRKMRYVHDGVFQAVGTHK
jgi:hypothetical protein